MIRAFGSRSFGLRLERMRASPLWVGDHFENVHPILPNLRDSSVPWPSLRDFFFGDPARFPGAPLPAMNPLDQWRHSPTSGLRITWLGHSTVLIEIDGVRVLTDPVWSARAFPVQFAGPRRFQPVPVKLTELPPIDVIVISHDHYDHLDYATIKRLRKSNVPFVTPLGVGAHLEMWGVSPERIHELDWWESFTLRDRDFTITATPSQHFSGRRWKDRNPTLWCSFALRSPHHAVFFSGDTGLTTEYERVRQACGPFDVTMLEIGAYYPAWGDIHLGPDNAMRAHAMLGGTLMPIHWGTFCLGMHAWDQPPERLLELASRSNVRLFIPQLGEAAEPSRIDRVHPWWRSIPHIHTTTPVIHEEHHADIAASAKMPGPLD